MFATSAAVRRAAAHSISDGTRHASSSVILSQACVAVAPARTACGGSSKVAVATPAGLRISTARACSDERRSSQTLPVGSTSTDSTGGYTGGMSVWRESRDRDDATGTHHIADLNDNSEHAIFRDSGKCTKAKRELPPGFVGRHVSDKRDDVTGRRMNYRRAFYCAAVAPRS